MTEITDSSPHAIEGSAAQVLGQPRKTQSFQAIVWRRLRRNHLAVLGALILAVMAISAAGAPWIAPQDPYEMNLRKSLQPVNSPGHLLGTDDEGRDTLSRLIYGGQVSMTVGLIVVGIAGSLGVLLGVVSGYYGGIRETIIMRSADVLLAFPFLVLALVIVAIVGPSLTNMMIVLGVVGWVEYARLVRSLVLVERGKEYIIAARALGVNNVRIIGRHILPNIFSVVIVQATFGVAVAILTAAALSFLGMGAQPPTAEWGAMLSAAKPYLRDQPILSIAPGMAIMITVLAVNFIGDALRDALDPRLRG